MRFSQMTTYQSGLFAEFLARWYLRFHGFRILKSRYVTGRNTGRAEIDIIAKRGNLLIFVEVKARPNIECAFDAITITQSARLRRAAETFVMQTNWYGDARFDIITVCGRKIRHFPGAL